MACFARETAPIQVRRPDNGTQGKANNQTGEDDENEWDQCKNEHIDPHLDHVATATISRYQVASEQKNSNVEGSGKNSGLNQCHRIGRNVAANGSRRDHRIDDRFTAPQGKDEHGYQQGHDPLNQQPARIR